MAYLTVDNLSVGYSGIPVAEGITFSMNAGDAVFVIGENGAGKSTLLRTLLGLEQPIDGTFCLAQGVGPGEVGYLPQRGESQRDFPASAWEVALSGRAARLGRRAFYSREDRDAVQEAMERVGAYAFRDKPFGSLSGGQQQRVLLARAMASRPQLLILDEPTTGLDPEAAESLWRTVDDLREAGAGVLAVTHDVAATRPHATHVLEICDGSCTFAAIADWHKGGDAA